MSKRGPVTHYIAPFNGLIVCGARFPGRARRFDRSAITAAEYPFASSRIARICSTDRRPSRPQICATAHSSSPFLSDPWSRKSFARMITQPGLVHAISLIGLRYGAFGEHAVLT